MRFLFVLFAILISMLSAQAQSSIEGTWANEGNDAHVKITSQSETLNGHIIWLAEKKAQDKVGTKVFLGLRPKGDEWKGKVYSVKRDETYSATYSLEDAGETMKVVISAGFLTKTQTWTRVKS